MNKHNTSASDTKSNNTARNLILLSVVAVVIVGIVYWATRSPQPTEGGLDLTDTPIERRQTSTAADRSAQDASADKPGSRSDSTAQEPAAVPVLEEVIDEDEREENEWVRSEVERLLGKRQTAILFPSNQPLQRIIGIIANASEGNIIARQIEFWKPRGEFRVRTSKGLIYLDKRSYRRFDRLVNRITSIDVQRLAGLFNRLEPALQSSYRLLGYKRGNVRTVLRSAIDRALVIKPNRDDILLKRVTVQYHFADPKLERLNAVSKQLLRIGPDNTEKLQAWLKRLRRSI